MPAAALLPVELILKLKEKKWSIKALAERFSVSPKVVAEALHDAEPDQATVLYADKLAALMKDVPNDYCRNELTRAVDFLRDYQAASRFAKCRRIQSAIGNGARSLGEIAEESSLHIAEAETLIGELVAEGVIEKRAPGGVDNRGRKLKYQYYLIEGV